MVFNSYTFILFFGVTAGLHYLPLPWSWKKRNLLLASYVFYAAWSPPFVLLLWASTVVDWNVARWMAGTDEPRRRRRLLYVSLAVNLGLLGWFKYAGFAVETFNALLGIVHIQFQAPPPSIILPAGISFYTFMTLSYCLDVYHRRAAPCKSFLDYALFVTFFPHLVAGPIVRAGEFTPQLESPKQASPGQFALGLSLMILGLFEKTVLADYFLGPVADQVFNVTKLPDPLSAWCGVVAFTGQIFCDFSGYTTCAIGIALCFGFAFPENFRFPFAALGFSDFWQRWHITLSRWLRDYVYIPLGGNRGGTPRTYRNLMLTMLIGGLWHGASWNFVIWGGLHGLFLIGEREVHRRIGEKSPVTGPLRVAMILGTFLCVSVAFVFFRSRTLAQAVGLCRSLVGLSATPAGMLFAMADVARIGLVMTALLTLHYCLRETTWVRVLAQMRWRTRGVFIALLLVLIILAPGADRAFLYFQF